MENYPPRNHRMMDRASEIDNPGGTINPTGFARSLAHGDEKQPTSSSDARGSSSKLVSALINFNVLHSLSSVLVISRSYVREGFKGEVTSD